MGFVHVGGGAHVTLDTQPAKLSEVSDVNTKVKHPVAVEAVKGPGIAVPEKVPSKAPAVVFPSYTLSKSSPASVAKEVKVTVTN